MASADAIRHVVQRYLDEVGNGTGASIAALYAPEATVKDPADSEAKVGLEAITDFYRNLEQVSRTAELLTVKVAGNSAAFHFRVVTTVGEQTFTIEPIDVMTFDEDARITSMHAYWSPEDVVTA